MASRRVAYAPSYDWVSDPNLRKELRGIVGVPDAVAQLLNHLALERREPRHGYLNRLRREQVTVRWADGAWGDPPEMESTVIRCGYGASLVYGRGNTVTIKGPGGYLRPVARHSPIWVLVVWALTVPIGPIPVL